MILKRRRARSAMGRAKGFSMIEVLIALLVLAFGLLGFALLQTLNLRFTQSANYRTEATNLASDLLDQMRTNRLSAAKYTTATFAAGAVTNDRCSRDVGMVSVEQSVGRWQCQVLEALGSQASAQVTYVAGKATVALTWGERESDDRQNSDKSTRFEVSTQL